MYDKHLVHLTVAAVGGSSGPCSQRQLSAFGQNCSGMITKSVRFGGKKFLNLAVIADLTVDEASWW